ncbi:ABC transporter permease [Microbacterium saperdae]|uniref:ABC transporter permease n=1 Tax=Microbacterium saperdae TaxID=69368 RepID=UPI001476CC27|nr:ABC transporter permease [Microbacterium saperdae]
MLLILVTGAFALVPIGDPLAGNLAERLLPIGTDGHPLGTDGQGRDLLIRLVHGTALSLFIGIAPIIVASVMGVVLGLAAGLGPRWVNQLIMRFSDVMFAFPGILFSLLVAVTLGVGVGTLILALTVIWIAPIVRIAETEVLRVRGFDFVAAARVSGAGNLRIAAQQVLPLVLPAVLAYATSLVGANIAIGGGLGFIGLGVPIPTPELGAILQELQVTVFTDPTLALLPVAVILSLAVLFPVVGDGLREALDVRGDNA